MTIEISRRRRSKLSNNCSTTTGARPSNGCVRRRGFGGQTPRALASPTLSQPASSPLLGRKRELADLRRLFLDGARLVTLTGPAGIGKTRLAHEFAREHGGVAVLDDARAEDVDGAAPTVATARAPLGVPGEHVYPLRPLAEAPAIELFRELAPSVDASYAELAELVRELRRIPAAIERAAAERERTTAT